MCRIKFQETLRMNDGLLDLSKKSCVRKNVTFFRKVRETNIYSKTFLKLDSPHFGIYRPNRYISTKSTYVRKKKFFFECFG